MGPSLCGITTLANPTPPSVFTFSNRNVYDTTINLASTGIPAYIIAHNGTPCDSIELYDLQMQDNNDVRRLSEKLNFENGIKATAMDTPLGRFHWRDHERYGVALCWADDVSMSFPVAYGQPSEEELGLVITSCGMPVVDYILASFILLHLDKYTSR
ncbi:hypothetical protein CPB85DRAFT_1434191 [Mucidula mucida]|nr:hypothetical protein CPB85DRAFT_1434191 [Mucidula mucida]